MKTNVFKFVQFQIYCRNFISEKDANGWSQYPIEIPARKSNNALKALDFDLKISQSLQNLIGISAAYLSSRPLDFKVIRQL